MTSKLTFYTTDNFRYSNGTSYQGKINASYSDLVEIFGKPLEGDEYKTDAEWIVVFRDGLVATIYNWKDGKNYLGDEGLAVEQIEDWHVGGKSSQSLDRIVQVLKNNNL
jgi:hypothetical protein